MTRANPAERLMLKLINQERAKANIDPLRFDSNLNTAAEKHTEWMLRKDVFDHTGAGGSNAGERMRDAGYRLTGNYKWGENIALRSEGGDAGMRDDVRDLHNRLMDSPGHRANILNPAFDEIGIGIERGMFRLNGSTFDAVAVTQDFGRTAANNTQQKAENILASEASADQFVLRPTGVHAGFTGQDEKLDLAATLNTAGDSAEWIRALEAAANPFQDRSMADDRGYDLFL